MMTNTAESNPTVMDDDDKPVVGGAKIVVTHNGSAVGKYRLAKRKIMIGRRHDCDIRINSRSASRHHAQIFSVLNNDYILDLDSKNGTYVNNKKIKKHSLENDDVISIGGFELRYMRDQDEE